MGLDVSCGTCYGIEIFSTIERKSGIDKKDGLLSELGRVETFITKYNQDTGNPYQLRKSEWMLEFNYDFMEYKKGDKISCEDWNRALYTSVDSEFNSGDRELIINSQCIGVKSFVGKEPYESPQDICIEYISDLDNAKKKWEMLFPNIPGKHLLYLHASY